MNLYEAGLSHLFGINPRKKTFKRAVAWALVIASVVTPITFSHAIWDYGQRRTAVIMKWYFDPMLKQLNANSYTPMEQAQQQQQQQDHK